MTRSTWLFVCCLCQQGCLGRTDLAAWENLGEDSESTGTGGNSDDGNHKASGGYGAGGGSSTASGGTPPSVDGSGGTPPTSNDVFVDCETAIEAGDGSSWLSPLRHPELAMDERSSGDTIFLKKGTCTPLVLGDAVLSIPERLLVTLAGGFDGDPTEPFAHSGGRTVLSGDMARNDAGFAFDGLTTEYAETHNDNSRLIVAVRASSDVTLTDLDIIGAHDSSGGDATYGAISVEQNATLTMQRSFIGNSMTVYGAALYAEPGSAIFLRDVTVQETLSLGGLGAVSLNGASLEIQGASVFRRNKAPYGAAIWLYESELEAHGATFEDNEAYAEGGAIFVTDAHSSAEIHSSEFIRGRAAYGGAVAVQKGWASLENCELWENSAAGYGGHLYARDGGLLVVTDSWLYAGSAAIGGQIATQNADVLLLGAHLYGGAAQTGGAIHSLGALGGLAEAIAVHQSTFARNTATHEASVLYVGEMETFINDTQFVENHSDGLPVLEAHGETFQLVRSLLQRNTGGPAILLNGTQAYVTDSYIGQHTSLADGVLVLRSDSTAMAMNVTFAENLTNDSSTPAMTVGAWSALDLQNSVIWSSAPAVEPWIVLSPDGTSISGPGSCGPTQMAAYGVTTTISASPFENLGNLFPLYQTTNSPCLDKGEDALALSDSHERSATYPFSLDTGTVDPGVHYSSEIPPSRSLEIQERHVAWQVSGEWPCHLTVLTERISYFGSSNDSFTWAEPHPAGTEYIVTCWDEEHLHPPIVMIGRK